MKQESSIGARPPMTVGRAINSMSYLASGAILIGLILKLGSDGTAWVIWLLALGSLAYGAYVGLTRGAYWVSSYTYAIPLVAVLFGWAIIR